MQPCFDTFAPNFDWTALKALSAGRETPFVLLNPQRTRHQYQQIQQAFPQAQVFYAIKANPDPALVAALAAEGCGFELASRAELELVQRFQVPPTRLAFGNTIKKSADIAYYYAAGVRLFATDSEADVRKLAHAAPGAKVYARLLAEPTATADWPLDRKFGSTPETAVSLLRLAHSLGLHAYGVSFHVGSQQNSPQAWDNALRRAAWVFTQLRTQGIHLRLVNLGGGFPVAYLKPVPTINAYASAIMDFVRQYFDDMPELMLEPGRYLVAQAGILVTEVMLIARKHDADPVRWVYTDVGLFGGLTEAGGEATKYPLVCERDGAGEEVVLAGPTCDGRDILYDKYRYTLPLSLEEGDRLYFLNAGAYTLSCGCVAYNGFAPAHACYSP
jgi:ornithine decarboxylase